MDNGGAGLNALTFQHHVGTLSTLNATASRAVTGNWTLNPMANPDRLRAMRAAYHIALGTQPIDAGDMAILRVIVKDPTSPHGGWLRAGTKHEVPREACIVGHCGNTYVWVMPEQSKDFADFALLMLNIATWVPPPSPPTLNLTVDKIPPITFGGFSRPQAAAPPAICPKVYEEQPPTIQRRLYEDSQLINRGLFFVPR
jgi:hypothetical protein